MSSKKSPTLSETLCHFQQSGWSYGKAAAHLGVDKGHLHHVLHGNRESASLLQRVAALPNVRKP